MVANHTSSPIIPVFLEDWVKLVTPGQCFEEFFILFNFLHVPCLKIFISKVLGYSIIVGASGVKVPQVIKIWNAKSGEGVSLTSVTFELLAIVISWAYSARNGFPFSTYGEAIFMTIQTSLIAFLVQKYSDKMAQGALYVLAFLAVLVFMFTIAPIQIVSFLATCNIFMMLASKLIQAWTNYQNGSTGQLSGVTILLLFLGSLARVFTSYQDTGDKLLVLSYTLAAMANGVLGLQVLHYWNSEVSLKTDKKKKN